MLTNDKPLAKFQWELAENFDGVFPISEIQKNHLNEIFAKAENLEKVAPAFYETIKSFIPNNIKIAETDPYIQALINKGIYRFNIDKSGEILPSILGENGRIIKQVRLKDISLTPKLGQSIINLQTQIAFAQVISEIRDIKVAIANLHTELQNDRIALAESAWQQLQQASKIIDSRIREAKLISISDNATKAKNRLFKEFERQKTFFDERNNRKFFSKIFDKVRQEEIDNKVNEIFKCLYVITRTVQSEVIAYSLLGEQDAVFQSIQQFRDFILKNELNDRDTFLEFNSYSSIDNKSIVNFFDKMPKNISKIPINIQENEYIQTEK